MALCAELGTLPTGAVPTRTKLQNFQIFGMVASKKSSLPFCDTGTVETRKWLAHTAVGIRLIYLSTIIGAVWLRKIGGFLRVQLTDFVLYWRHNTVLPTVFSISDVQKLCSSLRSFFKIIRVGKKLWRCWWKQIRSLGQKNISVVICLIKQK